MSTRRGVDPIASLTAVAVTVVGVLPVVNLTRDSGWLGAAVLAVVLVALLGAGLRALRAPGPVVVLAQVVGVALTAGALASTGTGVARLLPGSSWWADLRGAGEQALVAIRQQAAPLDAGDGITVLLVAGAGLMAVVIDAAAHSRRWVTVAGIPLVSTYVLTSSVLMTDLPWYWFVGPAAGFLALLVLDSRRRTTRWTPSAAPVEGRATLARGLGRGGRSAGLGALGLAIVLPATIPLMGAGWWDGPGSGGGGRTIRTDNPIVDLQRDLTRADNLDILSYTSSDGSGQYIRSVTLDTWDGEVWKTSDRSVPSGQQVSAGLPAPPGLADPDAFTEVAYDVQVEQAYQSQWLPLPYPAREVDIAGDWRFDAATLDIVSPDAATQGASYQVRAIDVRPEPEMLAGTTRRPPGLRELTELPPGLSPLVEEIALEVTAGAEDDLQAAVALQAFFRSDGNFVYDLSTPPGTSNDAMADFLTDRRGYCEQFAASMALMARTLDIPARVAVGFTPGTRDGDTWQVRSHDAHAWPELYFDGVGWVRFEPTPGVRTGRAPEWTVAPAAAQEEPAEATPTPSASATTDTSGLPGPEDPAGGAGSGTADDAGAPAWVWWTTAALVLLAALLVAPRLTAVLVVRRRWAATAAEDADGRRAAAEAAWAELHDTADDTGIAWDPAATPRQQAHSLHDTGELDDELTDRLRTMLHAVEHARFAPEPAQVEGDVLREHAAALRAHLLQGVDSRTRFTARWLPAAARRALPRRVGDFDLAAPETA